MIDEEKRWCIMHENWAGKIKYHKQLYLCKRCRKESDREVELWNKHVMESRGGKPF